MRSLQLCLSRNWNFQDPSVLVRWDDQCLRDLKWWFVPDRLHQGISLLQRQPDLALWSDASDQGWGCHLDGDYASGLWSPAETALSINLRELRAIKLGLLSFQETLSDKAVAIYSDNTSAIAYLRNQGGTISPSLVQEAREIILWAENHNVHLFPQFIMGKMNVLADSLSRANQVIGSEWTLNQEVVNSLMKKWPVTVDMFATALNYRLPLYVSPLKDPQAIGTDAFLQDWDNLSMYAFPPFAIIQKVISKLRLAKNSFMTLIAPLWPQKEWFPDLLDLSVDLPVALPNRKDLLKQPHFHRFHHNLRMLQLHAWRLSGDSQGRMASLDQWLNS